MDHGLTLVISEQIPEKAPEQGMEQVQDAKV